MLSKAAFFKSGSGAIPPTPVFGVSVTPSSLRRDIRSGSYTTSNFVANVTAGAPPFSYAWALSSADGSVVGSGSTVYVSTGGYNEEVEMTLTVTVTDATLAEVTDSANISLTFGVPSYASDL